MSEAFVNWASARSVPTDRAAVLDALAGVKAAALTEELVAKTTAATVTKAQLLGWLVQCLDVVIGPPPLVLPLQPALAVLLETMLRLHPFHGVEPTAGVSAGGLQDLTALKSTHLSQTFPVVSTALLDGVLKSDAFLECAGAAAGGMPRRWVDLTFLDPFTTLELLVQVLALYTPCFSYPLTAVLATLREYYWYSVGTVFLHSVVTATTAVAKEVSLLEADNNARNGVIVNRTTTSTATNSLASADAKITEWSEDFVRSLFKMPDLKTVAAELEAMKQWKEAQILANKKGSKKTRKTQREQLALPPTLTGNQRVAQNPATLVAIIALSKIGASTFNSTTSTNAPACSKFPSFLGVSSSLFLEPLHRLITQAVPAAQRPTISERGFLTIQRLVESNLKFQNVVRGDSACAGALLCEFSNYLPRKLGPMALGNCWVDPTIVAHAAGLWQTSLASKYHQLCDVRQSSSVGSLPRARGDSILTNPDVARVLASYRPIMTPMLWLKVFTETVKVAKRAPTAAPAPLGSLVLLRVLTSTKTAPWMGATKAMSLQAHRPVIAAHVCLTVQHLSQFVTWSQEPIGTLKVNPTAVGSSKKAKDGTISTETEVPSIPSELFFELSRDIFNVLAQEQAERPFEIPLLPPWSAAFATFVETALTPIAQQQGKQASGASKKGGGKGGQGGGVEKVSVPEHEMLPVHTPKVIQFLLSLLVATGAKKPAAVAWWSGLLKKVTTSSPLLRCTKVNQEMVRLLAAGCHHGVINVASEVSTLAGGAVLRNSMRQQDTVALALCRKVCTRVSALRRRSSAATAAIPIAWAEDLCVVLRDDSKPVHPDAVVSLVAAVTIGGLETGTRRSAKVRACLAELSRITALNAASYFSTDKAAEMSLKLLQTLIREAQAEVEELCDAARQKQEDDEAESVRRVLAHDIQRAKNHKATLEERKRQEERHRAFQSVHVARLTALRSAEKVKSAQAAEELRTKRDANLAKEIEKIDAKVKQQDDNRRLKAQQFIWAEKNLAAHSDFLRSLEVPLHRVLQVMTTLRKLHPTPATLGLISQQQVLELVVCGAEQGAKEPKDLKPYVTPTAGGGSAETNSEEDDAAPPGGDEEGMDQWFSDDGFDFWSTVEGETEGQAATAGGALGAGEDEEVEVDLREVAAQYTYHKRCHFLLNLFDFNNPEESSVPYPFLKTVVDPTEAPRQMGWTNATHCFLSLERKELVTKMGTGHNSTISLTPLGWAYHANYADPGETYGLYQLKVAEMIQQRSSEVEVDAEVAAEMAGGEKDTKEDGDHDEAEDEAEDDCLYFMDDIF